MKKIKIVIGLAAFYFLFNAGWQITACEIANLELQDDMQDMASQFGVRTGYSAVPTDDDLREAILRKAEKYEISLSPKNVVVMRTGSGAAASIYLEADYSVPIVVPGYSFRMYFDPASAHKVPRTAMAEETSP